MDLRITPISDAPDVNTTGRVTGQVLSWNSVTGKYDHVTISSANFSNADLTFDADRVHDTAGFAFQVSSDNGALGASWLGLYPAQSRSEYGYANTWDRFEAASKTTFVNNASTGTLFHLDKQVGIGASPAALTTLDVRAGGALSTDIPLRIRNSANTEDSLVIDGLGQGRIKSTSFIPKFSVGYDWFGSNRDAFVFTQSVQNFRGQAWTFNAGYNGSFEGLQISNDLTGNEQGLFTIQLNNYSFGTNILAGEYPLVDRRVMRLATGVAPVTSFADGFKMYSADIAAGNAAPHFRTENGDIVKAYSQDNTVAAAAFVANTSGIADDTATFGGFTIGQMAQALLNNGLLK